MSLFMIAFFTTMAAATTPYVNTAAGDSVECSDSSGGGAGFTFNPSPSTWVSAKTSATAFTVITVSSKTTTTTGIEYGIKSSETDVFQRQQTAATTTANIDPSSELLLGGTGDTAFKDKASNETS